jgi:hypothetical protein
LSPGAGGGGGGIGGLASPMGGLHERPLLHDAVDRARTAWRTSASGNRRSSGGSSMLGWGGGNHEPVLPR